MRRKTMAKVKRRKTCRMTIVTRVTIVLLRDSGERPRIVCSQLPSSGISSLLILVVYEIHSMS